MNAPTSEKMVPLSVARGATKLAAEIGRGSGDAYLFHWLSESAASPTREAAPDDAGLVEAAREANRKLLTEGYDAYTERRAVVVPATPQAAEPVELADARVLREANLALAMESHRLQEALSFYAEQQHLVGADRWESASGESEAWLCSNLADEQAMVEDGSTAREALQPFATPQAAEQGEQPVSLPTIYTDPRLRDNEVAITGKDGRDYIYLVTPSGKWIPTDEALQDRPQPSPPQAEEK